MVRRDTFEMRPLVRGHTQRGRHQQFVSHLRHLLASIPRNAQANKNSLVLNSLIVSLNFAAFSNSNRLAASRISLSSLTTYASNSSCDLNSGTPSASPPVKSV